MKKIAPYHFLIIICGVLFFWKLGATPLIGLDEGLYAECSREMVASGDYIVPRQNGGPFYDKPPLIYWLQSAGIRNFGVSSFSVRLPSAISALLLVGLVVFLGTRLFGKRAGLFSGFILSSSLLVVALARMCLLDQLFTLMITASLAAFLLSYIGTIGRWGYVAFWAAMAASIMVKGPAGAILIMGTVVAFLLISKQKKELLRAAPVLGLLVFCAIALPWFILVAKQTNGEFIREFFIHQNLQRAMGKDFQHNLPFFTYLPIYVVGFFPWSVFVPLAFKHHVRLINLSRQDAAPLFLAVWACAIVLIFSLSRSKLTSYILPSIPPSAMLVGLVWARAFEAKNLNALKPWALGASIVAAVVGVALQVGLRLLPAPIPGLDLVLIWMGISLVVGAILCMISLKLNRAQAAFASLFLGASAFLIVAVSLGLPVAARTNSIPIHNMASYIRRIPQSDVQIISCRLSPPQPAISFYAQRFVYSKLDFEDAVKLAKSKEPFYVLTQSDRQEGLPIGAKLVAAEKPYLLYRFE